MLYSAIKQWILVLFHFNFKCTKTKIIKNITDQNALFSHPMNTKPQKLLKPKAKIHNALWCPGRCWAKSEFLSHRRVLQRWKRQTCHGSVAGFGNGLLEQEADGHGYCVERGRVEWPSPSYLPFRSRCCQLCGAEIVIGVRLLLRFAPLDWRAERLGEKAGCRNTNLQA